MRALITAALISLAGFAKSQEIEQKLETLNREVESLQREIREIEDPDQKASAWEALREYTAAWYPFSFLYAPNGSDDLQEDSTEEVLLEAVYGAFTAEQAHYGRSIIHTEGDDERARELMILRAETLCRIYPLGRRIGFEEDVYFAQIILRIYEHSPHAVAAALKDNLSRWHGDERAIALLVLGHQGDITAQNELEELDSERVKKLSVVARAYFNPETGKAEQGVAPQSATRAESESESSYKPQPDSESRSR
ncbi:hypothetical protein [Sulfuriroseicoccus oceanibius]|uniref:Uncharacterized protein n=1 Tax=Sulfuriroseicoccus oceanibius TaxID=2707525 RepID=A0A6B3L466_9BACT|nr:hypothetical protein [Sulfuriroseicoccus oceanibius]QQL44585.1 hypothetical protein G3M56_011940 [Sulfuriroseicoccus oceanibius]